MNINYIESIITGNSCEWYDDEELMCDYVPVKHVSEKIYERMIQFGKKCFNAAKEQTYSKLSLDGTCDKYDNFEYYLKTLQDD